MLEQVTEKIVKRIADHGVESASECFAECLKFLKLCAANPQTSFVPSRLVDEGWHEFVLCTREYTEFCHAEAGAYIHHDPLDGPDEEGYQLTRQALLAQNGELNERFWPAVGAGACNGNCESGKCKSNAGSCTGTCSSGKCKTLI